MCVHVATFLEASESVEACSKGEFLSTAVSLKIFLTKFKCFFFS